MAKSKSQRLLFVLVVLAAICSASASAGGTELRALQLNTVDGHTQAIVSLSAAPQYRIFALRAPDRVVLDLTGTTLRSGTDLPAGMGSIVSIRAGQQPGSTLRLVFDMNAVLTPSVSTATSSVAGARWVVDFGTVARQSALAPPPDARPIESIETNQKYVVAIDAGHGGADLGAVGRSGAAEKDLTLAVARELAERINEVPDMRAVLIRSSDEPLSMRERWLRAEHAKANLLLSIHTDSTGNPDVNGAALYINATPAAVGGVTSWFADRENVSDTPSSGVADRTPLTQPVLNLVRSDMLVSDVSQRSAERLLRALQADNVLHRAEVTQGSFSVLGSSSVPSMLLSIGFISNRDDERRLGLSEYRSKLIAGIVRGLRPSVGGTAPDATQLATNGK